MHFKLIVAFVEDNKTDAIMHAAREAGATGCTVINNARGEGIAESKTFFGLTLATQRDVLLLLGSEIREAGVEVGLDLTGNLPRVAGNKVQLQQSRRLEHAESPLIDVGDDGYTFMLQESRPLFSWELSAPSLSCRSSSR